MDFDLKNVSKLNWVNLACFIINALFTYLVGVGGVFNLPNNTVLSEKYQTLVTPKGWAFSIWGLIFIGEGLFVILQLFKRFRSNDLVTAAGYWFSAACIMQVGWTFAFSLEIIWLSLVFMLLILASLAATQYKQYGLWDKSTYLEWWLLVFPLALHTGWITCASFVNINVTVVKYAVKDAHTQFAVAAISLCLLTSIAMLLTVGLWKQPNCVIPGVIAWASAGIQAELSAPREKVATLFGDNVIQGVLGATKGLWIIVALFAATFLLIRVVRNVRARSDSQAENSAPTKEIESANTPLAGTANQFV